MKFFIDTANIDEIKKANDLGVLDGVTTNPTLISREDVTDFYGHLRTICEIVDGPVSAEAISTDADGMISEGRDLSAIHENIAVKIPITTEGMRAIRVLASDGIRVNCTLVFTPLQALLAAKAGAAFVSPFVGRIDDAGGVGMEVVRDIISIFDNYEVPTEVLVASVRHVGHVLDAALMGADIATIPYKVISQLAKHPLTDIGIEMFLADWAKVKKN
jgi:transaldolase